MNEKRTPIQNEEPRHKKKSRRKGQPRADHKHEYKTVLLTEHYFMSDCMSATKVCQICGRIGDKDNSRYETVAIENLGSYRMVCEALEDRTKRDCRNG